MRELSPDEESVARGVGLIDVALRRWNDGAPIKSDIVLRAFTMSIAKVCYQSGCTTEAECNRIMPLLNDQMRAALLIAIEIMDERQERRSDV